MAISDFAFPLTFLPESLVATATGSWEWPIAGTAGLIACKLKNFLQRVSVAVSTGSLVWIALERFVAVVLPMKAHLISPRIRAFAIASTWFVAAVANCLDLYAFELVEYHQELFCTDDFNTAYSNITYFRVRTALTLIAPLVAMTILYCVIAVTLRRQDKALQCRAVHQKNQRKRRAIKMAVCVMAAFYICNLPLLIAYIVFESGITVSCLAWFLTYVLFYLSSTINPIICMAFVQSYRRGLREIFDPCCSKRMTTYSMETTSEPEQITLQEIREIGMNENLAFSET